MLPLASFPSLGKLLRAWLDCREQCYHYSLHAGWSSCNCFITGAADNFSAVLSRTDWTYLFIHLSVSARMVKISCSSFSGRGQGPEGALFPTPMLMQREEANKLASPHTSLRGRRGSFTQGCGILPQGSLPDPLGFQEPGAIPLSFVPGNIKSDTFEQLPPSNV